MIDQSRLTVGWREWVALPDLGIDAIKAKIDTGARTSALHTFALERFSRDGEPWVRFGVHPTQGTDDPQCRAAARVVDERCVTDSGGHREDRLVILTRLVMAGGDWPIEMTLTDRDTMRFKALIGRTALRGRILVDPGASFLTSAADTTTAHDSP